MSYPKAEYIRSKVLRESADGMPCMVNSEICQHAAETSVLAHSEWLEDGKGGSIKAHDIYATIACNHCHDYIDNRQRVGQSLMDRRDAFHRGMKRTWLLWIRAGFIKIDGFSSGFNVDRLAKQKLLDDLVSKLDNVRVYGSDKQAVITLLEETRAKL